ncbi:hypothetical protein [Streptomyces sp. NPDC055140]
MTPQEIQMLTVGIVLGGQGANAVHMVLGYRDERRSDAAAARRRRINAADAFHSSFRTYRIQHRSLA